VWLRGGCRQARVDHLGEPVVKNNFDPVGTLARGKHFERTHHMLDDQKKVLTDPHLDLRLAPKNLDNRDFLGYNIEFVDTGLPAVRNAKLLRQVVSRSASFDRALHNRHKVAQDKLHDFHRKVEHHMPGAKALEKKFRAKEVGLALDIRHMLVDVQVVAAMHNLRAIMHVGRVYRFSKNCAARKIQRLARVLRVLRGIKGTRCWARSILKPWVASVMRCRRANNKNPSVDVIKDFLNNMKMAAAVLPMVHRFKAKIVRLQRAIKRYSSRIRAVVADNIVVWDRVEYKVIKMLHIQREKQKRGRSTRNVFQRVPSASKEELDRIAQLVSEIRLPDDVRSAAIRAYMKECRDTYVSLASPAPWPQTLLPIATLLYAAVKSAVADSVVFD